MSFPKHGQFCNGLQEFQESGISLPEVQQGRRQADFQVFSSPSVQDFRTESDRKQVVDASNEKSNFVMPGLQWKYRPTAVVFVSTECEKICHFCFRRPRLFEGHIYETDVVADLDSAVSFIREQKEISNVLLTGGDALLADMDYLREFMSQVDRIEHVKAMRLGTRMPIYRPEALDKIGFINEIKKPIYISLNIIRADELKDGLSFFTRHLNARFMAQMPLLRGVNDSPEKQVEMWERVVELGINPYYTFQCRPIMGNEEFLMPLGRGYDIFQKAQNMCSGTTKRSRYVMSCNAGKLEIIGRQGEVVLLKYHQARNVENLGKIFSYPADENWYN